MPNPDVVMNAVLCERLTELPARIISDMVNSMHNDEWRIEFKKIVCKLDSIGLLAYALEPERPVTLTMVDSANDDWPARGGLPPLMGMSLDWYKFRYAGGAPYTPRRR